MSPILVKRTSHCDSHLEHSNTSFSEIELDDVDLNSNRRDCNVNKQNMNATTASEHLDMRPITGRYFMNIAEKLLSDKGCKQEQNLNKFKARIAGMFHVMRSCDIRLSQFEMYTAKSLSMVFLSLIDIFTAEPDQQQLTRIVCDRGCDLVPYLQRPSREGNVVAERYATLRYIVDIFHCEQHTQLKCVLGDKYADTILIYCSSMISER